MLDEPNVEGENRIGNESLLGRKDRGDRFQRLEGAARCVGSCFEMTKRNGTQDVPRVRQMKGKWGKLERSEGFDQQRLGFEELLLVFGSDMQGYSSYIVCILPHSAQARTDEAKV